MQFNHFILFYELNTNSLSAHIHTAYSLPVFLLAITPISTSAYIVAPSFIVIPMWCTIVVPFSLVFKWKITSITSIIHANSSWKRIRKEKIWNRNVDLTNFTEIFMLSKNLSYWLLKIILTLIFSVTRYITTTQPNKD